MTTISTHIKVPSVFHSFARCVWVGSGCACMYTCVGKCVFGHANCRTDCELCFNKLSRKTPTYYFLKILDCYSSY